MARTLGLALGCAAILLGATPPRKIFPYPYTQQDLPNGLRLIVTPTGLPNIVATYIVVQTGSRNEVEPGHTGFAHLFEHLMFKGTPKYPTARYNETMRRIGASSNASTSDDYTVYYTVFSKEDLDPVLAMEADRFQNLKYSETEFRTESLAVLGEYNKNSSSPFNKLSEALRETAFDQSTYKHTAMGFLEDIRKMPEQYNYSKQFFERYYRPEYTTILVAGDVQPKDVRNLVDRYWGSWKRGEYKPEIPVEPQQKEPKVRHLAWPSPTLPMLTIGYKGPAYTDSAPDTAALDALAELAFSPNSDLYQKLVVKDQTADILGAQAPSLMDVGLFRIVARVKKAGDLDSVRDQILATVRGFQETPVDAARLDAVRKRLRYAAAMQMQSSDAIAQLASTFIALRRTPETMNRLFDQYAQLKPEDVKQAAAKYLGGELADDRDDDLFRGRTVKLAAAVLAATAAYGQIRLIPQPSKSPLMTIRVVFSAGAAADPPGKHGLANLTAMMIADGGTKELTYQQVTDTLFPMAATFNSQVDKEMTAFIGATHSDNAGEFYKIFRDRILDPGWRPEDFARLRDQAIHNITDSLRNNDEELAKEVLYEKIYATTPYGHYNGGSLKCLESLTLDDVKAFYRTHYTLSNLYLGIAGGYSDSFLETMKKDFRRLPASGGFRPRMTDPPLIENSNVVIVQKQTSAVALSMGFPISITRDRPDFPALLVAASYFGQHRMSGGVLYEEMREKRGLNYGDYAYIEHFPQGTYLMEPPQNVGRHYQIFQIWVRPVEPANAKFALRTAIYQLEQLRRNGIPQDAFEQTRDFLSKHINVLMRTERARLGYGIDDIWYGAGSYESRLHTALSKMTRAEVNQAIKRYLRADRIVISAVAKDAESLKQQLVSDDPSPMQYNSPKPDSMLETDRIAEKWPLHLRPEDIKIVPVDQVFQQ